MFVLNLLRTRDDSFEYLFLAIKGEFYYWRPFFIFFLFLKKICALRGVGHGLVLAICCFNIVLTLGRTGSHSINGLHGTRVVGKGYLGSGWPVLMYALIG